MKGFDIFCDLDWYILAVWPAVYDYEAILILQII